MHKLHFAIFFRGIGAGLIVGVVLSLSSTFVQAGPCSKDVAQFEAAMRQFDDNQFSGLTVPQSIGAQLD